MLLESQLPEHGASSPPSPGHEGPAVFRVCSTPERLWFVLSEAPDSKAVTAKAFVGLLEDLDACLGGTAPLASCMQQAMAAHVFITSRHLLIGRIQLSTGEVFLASHGHPAPILLPATAPAVALPSLMEHRFTVSHGDLLLVPSVSILQCINPNGDVMGHSRLLALLERNRPRPVANGALPAKLPRPKDYARLLTAACVRFQGRQELTQDLAVLAIERR